MKRVVLLGLSILFCIFIVVLTSYKITTNKNQDINKDYFNKISNISIDEIKEIQITYKQNGNIQLNQIIKNNDDIKAIINFINSLKLNKMNGNIGTLQSNLKKYEIILVEKDYYPPGAIFISEHSVWFESKEYYFHEDIGKEFKDLIYKF